MKLVKHVFIGTAVTLFAACGTPAGVDDDSTLSGGDQTLGEGHHALVVEANGNPIGYLQSVQPDTVSVWDSERDLLFTLNDTTGYVANGVPGYPSYYTQPGCQGDRYAVWAWSCGATTAPARRYVAGVDNDLSGLVEATELVTHTGAPFITSIESVLSDGVCQDAAFTALCVVSVQPTTEIPTAFDLPISIVEAP